MTTLQHRKVKYNKRFVINYYRKALRYCNTGLHKHTIHPSEEVKAGNISSNNLSVRIFINKAVSFFSYFSFGLAGVIFIMLSFINGKKPDRSVIRHTINAMKLGVAVAAGIFILKVLMLLSPYAIDFLNLFSSHFQYITNLYPLITFIIAAILAIRCLLVDITKEKAT